MLLLLFVRCLLSIVKYYLRKDTLENDLNTDLFVLQSHLESMLECVKQNSAILSRFQAFEMRLLNLVSLADMIDLVLEIAERIRKTIHALVIKLDGGSISVTISIGSSTYLPDTAFSPIDNDISSRLIKMADSALYKAKRNGRNRVENGGVICAGKIESGPQVS